ncbi:hypothetical protein ACLMJK_006854 [Lecanora helva]
MEDTLGTKLQEKWPNMRGMSCSSRSHTLLHQELASLNARLRLSELRYSLGFQGRPLQDSSYFTPYKNSYDALHSEAGHANLSVPVLRFSPPPWLSILRQSPKVAFTDAKTTYDPDPLGSHQLRFNRNFTGMGQPQISISNQEGPPSIFQLPGSVHNIPVMALPDTGSSQNVIDQSLLRCLPPSVDIHPLDNVVEKLRAPDGEIIPCNEKVRLNWKFQNEEEVYERWFFVVVNCSHRVIIGNGLLLDSETMTKHHRRLKINKPTDPAAFPGHLVSENRQDDHWHQFISELLNGQQVLASLDTGCEANLMSAEQAKSLDLNIVPLSTGNNEVKFANGRRRTTMGQVEVEWSFDDDPTVASKIKCYVLPTCIHPIIFGDRFIWAEEPWAKHQPSLSVVKSSDAETGVVGLEKPFCQWLFRKPKVDPEAEKIHSKKVAEKRELEERLRSQSTAQNSSQRPSTPPPAVLAHVPARASTQAIPPTPRLSTRRGSLDPSSFATANAFNVPRQPEPSSAASGSR